MGGIDLMFHLASALVLVGLVHLAFEYKRQRDLVRELLIVQRRANAVGRVYVEAPAAFLGRMAKALDIDMEGQLDPAVAPRRIDAKPFMDLFLQAGIELIRFAGTSIEIRSAAPRGSEQDWQRRLSDALGDGVSVQLLGDSK